MKIEISDEKWKQVVVYWNKIKVHVAKSSDKSLSESVDFLDEALFIQQIPQFKSPAVSIGTMSEIMNEIDIDVENEHKLNPKSSSSSSSSLNNSKYSNKIQEFISKPVGVLCCLCFGLNVKYVFCVLFCFILCFGTTVSKHSTICQ